MPILDKDTDVLRHISRDNVKEMKKGQKRGRDDSDKNPMVEIHVVQPTCQAGET